MPYVIRTENPTSTTLSAENKYLTKGQCYGRNWIRITKCCLSTCLKTCVAVLFSTRASSESLFFAFVDFVLFVGSFSCFPCLLLLVCYLAFFFGGSNMAITLHGKLACLSCCLWDSFSWNAIAAFFRLDVQGYCILNVAEANCLKLVVNTWFQTIALSGIQLRTQWFASSPNILSGSSGWIT